MKNRGNSHKLWLEIGYKLFSEEGHEGLQVERLARILGRNKSGFYHYFGKMDTFLSELIQKHHKVADEMIKKIKNLESFDPEVIHLMMEYSSAILFQMQLVKNNHIPLFSQAQAEVTFKFRNSILPLWANYLGIEPGPASKMWDYVRAQFFAQLTSKNMSLECVQATFSEAKTFTKKLLAEQFLNI